MIPLSSLQQDGRILLISSCAKPTIATMVSIKVINDFFMKLPISAAKVVILFYVAKKYKEFLFKKTKKGYPIIIGCPHLS
jgi:hypothetical protein